MNVNTVFTLRQNPATKRWWLRGKWGLPICAYDRPNGFPSAGEALDHLRVVANYSSPEGAACISSARSLPHS